MRPFSQRRRVINNMNYAKVVALFIFSSISSAIIFIIIDGRSFSSVDAYDVLQLTSILFLPFVVLYASSLLFLRIFGFKVFRFNINPLAGIRLISPLEDRSVDGALLQLERRVKALEARAWLILLMIVLTVAATIVAILFVGQLDGGKSNGVLSDMRSSIIELERDYDNIMSRYRESSILRDAFDARAKMLENHLGKARESHAKYLSELTPNGKATSEVVGIDNLIVSALTRLAIFGMMIFFVKILIDLYRYNVRLIAFYNSRKDALRIVGDPESAAFKKCAEVFMPKLGFGKEPQSPVDQAVFGVTQIASVVRTGGAVFKGFRRGGKAAE